MDEQKPFKKRAIQKIYSKPKITYVYGLIDPRDGSLFWVGMTNAPSLRYDQHAYEFTKNNPKKQKTIDDIIKAGQLPGMILIDEFKTREEAANLEKNLIVFLSGVTAIGLKNIEHMPDKSWAFKNSLRAERTGHLWEIEERLVLIGLYNKGAPCELIAKNLQRPKFSVYLELHKAQNAGFVSIRVTDKGFVARALADSKYPVKDLKEDEKNQISSSLHKVSMRYGELNADHLKYGFTTHKTTSGGN